MYTAKNNPDGKPLRKRKTINFRFGDKHKEYLSLIHI